MSDEVQHLAIEPVHRPHARAAKVHGAGDDRVKDGLDVGGRTGDHAEDLARRGLLLQGLR